MLRRHLKLSRAHALEDIKQLRSWHVDKEKINQGWAKKVETVKLPDKGKYFVMTRLL